MMSSRIALISDIHANLEALRAVLADIDHRNSEAAVDGIYCLGDIGGYGPLPNETQELLVSRGYSTVMGNYDENVGFDGPDCGCQYRDAFEIKMSDISFTWTRDHTTSEN